MAKKKIGIPKGEISSKSEKPPKAKQVKIEHLHPKAKNKSSVTDNIKSISAKAVEDSGLGKVQRVALNQKLSITPKRKK